MYRNDSESWLASQRPGSQIPQPAVDVDRIEQLARELLEAVGENPEREGLRDTPRRYAKWWQEFIAYQPGKIETSFESVSTDQMVVVSGLRVWSLCEHHLLPFWCDVSIGYISRDSILGLSKFARVAHEAAHRLQVQERLAEQIADRVEALTASPDIAVLVRGEHTCMVMRGIKTSGLMTTSVMRGIFRTTDARSEFLTLAHGQR